MNIDWEVVVGVIIIAFFGYVLWRGGSANPVGTGQLQSQLNTVGGKVSKLEAAIGACATVSDLNTLSGKFVEMEKRVASSGEVVALEGQLAVVNTRISAVEKATDRTYETVVRIEDYLRGREK